MKTASDTDKGTQSMSRNQGAVVSVHGTVVDVRFERQLPAIYSMLRAGPDGRIAFVSGLIGGATIAVFLVEKRLGMSLQLSRTLAVNTLVCGQAFYLFNNRFLRESSLSASRLFTNRRCFRLGHVGRTPRAN